MRWLLCLGRGIFGVVPWLRRAPFELHMIIGRHGSGHHGGRRLHCRPLLLFWYVNRPSVHWKSVDSLQGTIFDMFHGFTQENLKF